MSDYQCPTCGCGFTKNMGKKRVDPPWKEQDLEWWQRLVCEMEDAFVMRSYYIIQCPNCEYDF